VVPIGFTWAFIGWRKAKVELALDDRVTGRPRTNTKVGGVREPRKVRSAWGCSRLVYLKALYMCSLRTEFVAKASKIHYESRYSDSKSTHSSFPQPQLQDGSHPHHSSSSNSVHARQGKRSSLQRYFDGLDARHAHPTRGKPV
jgi:hypothetical protein